MSLCPRKPRILVFGKQEWNRDKLWAKILHPYGVIRFTDKYGRKRFGILQVYKCILILTIFHVATRTHEHVKWEGSPSLYSSGARHDDVARIEALANQLNRRPSSKSSGDRHSLFTHDLRAQSRRMLKEACASRCRKGMDRGLAGNTVVRLLYSDYS